MDVHVGRETGNAGKMLTVLGFDVRVSIYQTSILPHTENNLKRSAEYNRTYISLIFPVLGRATALQFNISARLHNLL